MKFNVRPVMKFNVRPVPPEEVYADNCARLGEHNKDDLDDLEKALESSKRKIAAHNRAIFQPLLPGADKWGLEK